MIPLASPGWFGLPYPGEPNHHFGKVGDRFYFFSREESRMHVHVHHAEGEAKFWLEPEVELAQNYGLSQRRITAVVGLIRRHQDAIRAAWDAHFRR